jgi:alpha-mannosidase
LVSTLASQPGERPARWGLLEIIPANVVLSALKPSESGDACVLRVYEAEGVATKATVRFAAAIGSVEEVNLMEDPGVAAVVQEDTLQFDLRPFEIKTFKLQVQPVPAQAVTTARH